MADAVEAKRFIVFTHEADAERFTTWRHDVDASLATVIKGSASPPAL